MGYELVGKPRARVQMYSHADWLGTARTISSSARTWVGSEAFAPFGEPYAKSGQMQELFTNQDNDEANDLYDFPFRELHRTQGRWLSPDPAGLGAVDPTNPQSWNRYAYVANNPLALTDPTGMATGLGQCPAPGLPVCQGGYYLGLSTDMWFTSGWDEFDLLEVAFNHQFVPGGTVTAVAYYDGQPIGGSTTLYPNISALSLLPQDSKWWGTFARSFFRDFSFASARNPGEKYTHCVSRVRAAGGSFTTAVDATTGVGLLTSLASYPSLIKSAVPLSPDLFKSAGTFGRAVVSNSFLEQAAMEGSMVHGSLPASSVAMAQNASSALWKVAGPVTAAAIGLELGSLGACR